MFQSQTRSRSTCDILNSFAASVNVYVSISDEKPLHMRRKRKAPASRLEQEFQSQTRSRSTCDVVLTLQVVGSVVRFNLRREAAPHATAYNSRASCTSGLVSISDEKPLHMRRPAHPGEHQIGVQSFNLRREAAPHATSPLSVWLMRS